MGKMISQEKLAAIGKISGSIAHELRNPLSVIQAALYNINRKKENAPIDNQIQTIEKKIMESELLPGLLHQEVFAPLAHYLQDDAILQDKQAPHSLKLYQLCGQIADIFDQYLVYRPDWILAWEQGLDTLPPSERTLDPAQRWQSVLWRALIEHNHHTLGLSRYHRANLHQALFDAIMQGRADDARHDPVRRTRPGLLDRRGQGPGVGAIQTQWCIDLSLHVLDQPDQVVWLLLGMGASVDVEPG